MFNHIFGKSFTCVLMFATAVLGENSANASMMQFCEDYTVSVEGGDSESGTYCWIVDFGGNDGGGTGVPPIDTGGGSTPEKLSCWKGVTDSPGISSPYGQRMLNGQPDNHPGVDIISQTANYGLGAPIQSVASGTVIEASYNQNNGNFVRVADDDGTESVYLHLQSTMVAAGAYIDANVQIGTMNCTGLCFGPGGVQNAISGTHLHLQIYTDMTLAATENPIQYLGGLSCN